MTQPHALEVDATLKALSVDAERGLDDKTVLRRHREHGPNRLQAADEAKWWRVLADQFRSLVIAILAAAVVLSSVMGEVVQAFAILGVIVVNAAIGFVTEWRAVRSMEALRSLGTVRSRVRRGGDSRMVDAEALVPGDVVLLEAGDVVTADLRLIEANGLSCDESALTGESVPTTKRTDPVDAEAPLAERSSMAFKGTAVTGGSGAGVVVATGMATELGAVARMVEAAEQEVTPLEKRLDRLARRLVLLTLVVAAVVAALGWVGGKDVVTMLETAVALAVAAVPEGLPIVATVALARGMWRMAQRNALVERLAAVETLGSTNVVFADKTGTLTENRMRLARLALPGCDEDVDWRPGHRPEEPPGLARRLLEVASLCNNAELAAAPDERQRGADRAGDGEPPAAGTGDAMELALLAAAGAVGLGRDALLEHQPEAREVSFDSDTKMMATLHRTEDGVRVAVKGAPEAVLAAASRVATADGEARPLADDDRRRWNARVTALAEQGLRVLAFAERSVETVDADPYAELTLLGLAGLADPPRADAVDAVGRCRTAGIRVVMVTGDQPVTAASIARQVGLAEEPTPLAGRDLPDLDAVGADAHAALRRRRVFARVSPGQKLDLVRLWQETGAVVAMTGDGVNDAPALKKADVGIAMGRRGTEVAREAADIVLKDDAFSTIVAAIEQGRTIFENIRRFIVFLLSGNLGQVLAVGFCASVGAPLPLLPLQILFINLVLDVFPALALGVGESPSGIMQRPPRDPKEPILTRRHWTGTALWGLLIAVAATAVFFAALGPLELGREQAVTAAFLTFALARLWHVFNMRDPASPVLDNEVVRNRWVWAAVGLCVALVAMAALMPGLTTILEVVPLDPLGWTLVIAGSLAPLAVGQAVLSLMPAPAPSGDDAAPTATPHRARPPVASR
ncbi:MAG: cation-translocating P-type ATPase [Alphaproteobacteria bacterium]